jgi:hypothetical protein
MFLTAYVNCFLACLRYSADTAQGVIVLTPSHSDFLGLYALADSGESFDGMQFRFMHLGTTNILDRRRSRSA